MPLRPCPNTSNCVGTDEPISNYSSEALDPLDYVSDQFFGSFPPLLQNWSVIECGQTFTSTVSQEDADLRALAAANNCVVTKQNPTPNQPFVSNTLQTCTVKCPDGSPFTYTIPAGLFIGLNQATVNAQAHNLACALARENVLCFGNLPDADTCVNQPFTAQIPVAANFTRQLFFSFADSNYPPGLTISNAGEMVALLSGTPTQAGSFTFGINANDLLGNHTLKYFTLCVVDLLPTTLPMGLPGIAYFAILSPTCGPTNAENFQVVSGSLPPGLTLNQSQGIISGTPTMNGTFTFTIQFSNEAT